MSSSHPLITEVTCSSPSNQPPKPAPRTFPVPPSSLLSRVAAFLPLIDQANKTLEVSKLGGQTVQIDASLKEMKNSEKTKENHQNVKYKADQENDSDSSNESCCDAPTIEMELQLGVLEEIQQQKEVEIKLVERSENQNTQENEQTNQNKALIEEL
jgi:hypothetical protein